MAKRKPQQKKVQINALEQINRNAAGIDIGAEEVWVAVPPDRDENNVRSEVFLNLPRVLEPITQTLL